MLKNTARPKAYFTMWLMLYKKLATVGRLAKWGVEVSKTCVLCLNKEMTIEHLIVQCQYARYLWERLVTWTQQHSVTPANWDQFIQWSIQHGKGKARATQIFKIIFVECVYGVWIERNNTIFKKKRQTTVSVAKEITYVTIARALSRIKNVLTAFKF
ncbi:hypothetical protein R3W88_001318 [Solanum pinnatisectum]|uniref:Reverse transcriptase zinc-binding domain-containing protein n=1 Tax=Solanum pinnatisectum TaxID=50273 RepID=A0AAV9MHT8_9SOLN|nr:hypothetical protein R3W88_001318 [Solanum pinnatisectum]